MSSMTPAPWSSVCTCRRWDCNECAPDLDEVPRSAVLLTDITPSRAFKDMTREELAEYRAEQAELDRLELPF